MNMPNTNSQREKLRSQRKAASRKTTTIIIIVIAAIALIVFGVQMLLNQPVETSKLPNQDGFALGDPNAPVKVEEFSDFRCSHCKDFSENMEPDFIEQYVNTGKVYLKFYNFPFLAEDSTAAAEAAYCAADQNAFWQYKTQLFTYNTYTGAYTESNLIDYAKKVGLDVEAFEQCLQSDEHLDDVAADKVYATTLGVNATPVFSVNGTLVYSNELVATVEAALASASE
jgi:protein-disulfide isomerase